MGVIEVVYKTRDEAEGVALVMKYGKHPHRSGEYMSFQIDDEAQSYLRSEEFQKYKSEVKSMMDAIDGVRRAMGAAPAAAKPAKPRGKNVRMTDEMMKILKECKARGEKAADAQRKIAAVLGEAPGYATVLNYYKKA